MGYDDNIIDNNNGNKLSRINGKGQDISSDLDYSFGTSISTENIDEELIVSSDIKQPITEASVEEPFDISMVRPVRVSEAKDKISNNNNNGQPIPKKKGKYKKRIISSIICGVVGIFVGLLVFGLWYKNYLLGQIVYEQPESTFVDESGNVVNLETYAPSTVFEYVEEEEIKNFLLIGTDSRSRNYSEDGTGALSDVIMVLSVNLDKGTIKLVSIARDCYAYFPGYSNPQKINAAMSLGGPNLLLATVENQLRINIDGYAYVNFYNMAGVINEVGGVYLDVSEAERGNMNTNLTELGLTDQLVYNTGYIWVNGNQAVAYARIRMIDSDYKRSERQVEVLRSLLSQFMSKDVLSKAACIDDILSLVCTNVSQSDIEDYVLDFLPSLTNVSLEYIQLPIEGCFNSGMYSGEWSIRPNWNAMIPYVQEFFYGEVSDFDQVDDISQAPPLESCNLDIDLEDLLK